MLCIATIVWPVASSAAPAVALYYGHSTPIKEFRAFDMVVVEPDHNQALQQLPGTDQYAYVSVAEVQASRPYYADIPAQWKLARNGAWKSDVIDQTPPEWADFFARRVIAPLWERGYRGFFLDTLDSYRLAINFDEKAQQQGLVRVIETLHQRFPGIKLVLNRGFEIVPQVRDKIQMVAAESLYQAWNANSQRYEEVSETDRNWLLGQLRAIRDQERLPVLVIDYVAPQDRALTRATAARIQAEGFIPWVTDSALQTMGIGSIETVPRRILILYSSAEAASLNYSNAHRYLQMPINHMGYIADYADALQPLPEGVLRDRYAGVATWFSGFLPEGRRKAVSQWLQNHMDEGMPLAIVGDLGQSPDIQWANKLGVQTGAVEPNGALRMTAQNPMLAFETAMPLVTRSYEPVALTPAMAARAQALVEFRDSRQRAFVGGALTPWGGFILDPYAVIEIPGTEFSRWVVDPFAFLTHALRLPVIPIPDTTTENGRRLLLAHVDGDGFASLAELPGSPPAAQVLLKDVFEKYRFPQTMSVIEAEIAPHGLHPDLSPRLESIAQQMFKLAHIEIGNHTYSHPFLWDRSTLHGLFKDNEEAAYNLNIPGYTMDLTREIVGSTTYIRERLAPKGKAVKILQWSGDTAPDAKALEITERAGLLNINGGDTSITLANPSLTAVGALGIRKNGYLQVYAPITNENIYTNLWRGPFYGFERAIETFDMTDKPRRIKPVGIYYHVYSASKQAGLKALHKVYGWALAHPLYPVFTSEFILKVQDFDSVAIARDGAGWRVRSDGHLRTLRLPPALGTPDLLTSNGVAGYRPGQEGLYVLLSGNHATLQVQDASTKASGQTPYLFEANGRLTGWTRSDREPRLELELQAHVPLEFALVGASQCQVKAKQRTLTPTPGGPLALPGIQYFRLQETHAQIQLNCPAR
ncbi:bifunctional glycoside hydrolase 114/ polysaccharide deacetylase family protein [Candidatus Aalborgicola defluviihabitans]|uniref:bifunctional glycoside hydrolase 114/ polysaccharide deacetylase family protein n=1 Tax=Candidatus Aalborgicola defluviihabitans TaxID=3386187 RepID=UPI0039B990AA